MAIVYKAKCKVCDTIKIDQGLLTRIFESSFYIEGSPLTLKEIWREAGAEDAPFSYLSLTKHVKKHQFMSQTELEREKVNKVVADAQARALKNQLENLTHGGVRAAVMEKGMEALNAGTMKISAKDMLSAANKEADIEEKQKDRNLQIMDMVFAYASGELGQSTLGSPEAIGSSSRFIATDSN